MINYKRAPPPLLKTSISQKKKQQYHLLENYESTSASSKNLDFQRKRRNITVLINYQRAPPPLLKMLAKGKEKDTVLINYKRAPPPLLKTLIFKGKETISPFWKL